MTRLIAPLSLLLFGAPLTDAALLGRGGAADPRGEYLIVSGGSSLREWELLRAEPHDFWWGNYIRAARIRMTQLIKQNPDVNLTWLVYRPAYVSRGAAEGESRIDNILSVPEMFAHDYDHPIRLIWFDRSEQLIDHVNTRGRRNKIIGFEFFGHSNAPDFMFDYSNHISGASRAWLHASELDRLRRRAFDRNAYCKSWGCYSGQDFCRAFRRATGVAMWGATGKTDYAVLKDGRLPVVSYPDEWVRP
jgi:hypothetical protein